VWNIFPTIGVSDDQLWLGSTREVMAWGQSLGLFCCPAHIESPDWGGRARWDSLKMASGEVLCVGAPLAAPLFRAVRKQPPQGPYHFLAEFLVLRGFQMPVPPILSVPTESSSVLDIALGNCYRADSTVVFILHFLLDVP